MRQVDGGAGLADPALVVADRNNVGCQSASVVRRGNENSLFDDGPKVKDNLEYHRELRPDYPLGYAHGTYRVPCLRPFLSGELLPPWLVIPIKLSGDSNRLR